MSCTPVCLVSEFTRVICHVNLLLLRARLFCLVTTCGDVEVHRVIILGYLLSLQLYQSVYELIRYKQVVIVLDVSV